MSELGRKSELNSLKEQSQASQEIAKTLGNLERRLESLESTIKSSSESSGRVAIALNILTGALVVIGVVSLYVQYSNAS